MDEDKKADQAGNLPEESLICIPLYVLTKEYINIYKACLKRINLTFTQFIVMVVLWRKREMRVKEIGKCLFLGA